MTNSNPAPAGWRLHDTLIGVLGGGGLGAVIGLYAAARVLDTSVPVTIGVAALIGAIVGVMMMLQTRRNSDGFWTTTTIVMWIIAVASIAFLVFFYDAVQNFS